MAKFLFEPLILTFSIYSMLTTMIFFSLSSSYRSVKDLHPGWCLLDGIRAVPAAELVCCSITAQKTQTKVEAENH